ncbi:pfs [Fusarium proliferatum]|nr:pfs [Fusarium proliferatum]
MPGHDIRLFALDGGGVRGLSSLMILQNLMSTIDPDAPPKPCDYFDMIAGTSSGGLIAIVLGRLRMTVDECIDAYTSLSNKVFEKKSHRTKINGQLTVAEPPSVPGVHRDGRPCAQARADDVLGIWATLTSLATETEKTAEQFRRDKSSLDDEGRYYRFNVSRGLEDVGLAESKKQREIAAATGRITNQPSQDFGLFKTPFSLDGAPASDKFVARPADTAELEKCLLPQRSHARRTSRKIFVLFGLGGVGKTQLSIDFARRHQAAFSSVFWLDGRSEDQLKRSIAGCISKIPKDQVPETSRRWTDSRTHS